MIEVGSFIGMAAMCGAGVRIKDVSVRNLGIIPEAFRRLGVKIKIEGDDLFIPEQKHYVIDSFIDGTIMTLADAPWPGLTPDLLSVLLVVAACSSIRRCSRADCSSSTSSSIWVHRLFSATRTVLWWWATTIRFDSVPAE